MRQPNADSLDSECAEWTSDLDVIRWLADVLRVVPARLPRFRRPYPQLRALSRWDASVGTNTAAQLTMIAAVIYAEGDERDTAEYLLRHRNEARVGEGSLEALIRSAVRAMEHDRWRAQITERATEPMCLAAWQTDNRSDLTDQPSVADIVIDVAQRATMRRLDDYAHSLLAEGVVSAMELADRYRAKGGTGNALIAMRPSARRPARLVTSLRGIVGDPIVASRLARLLIGSEGASLETSLLWWTAHRPADIDSIPELARRRWARDLDAVFRDSSSPAA